LAVGNGHQQHNIGYWWLAVSVAPTAATNGAWGPRAVAVATRALWGANAAFENVHGFAPSAGVHSGF